MQATRQQILEHLRLHRTATVKELCALFGLTATGIRQHLLILEEEGLVEREEVRGRVGRPALRYSLTRRGEAMFPRGYDELANALIEEVRAQHGSAGLQQVLLGVARRLAGTIPSTVAERSPEQRVASAVAMFEERGVVADWERAGDAFLLHERTCPYPEVARQSSVSCAMEVSLLRLVTGLDTRLVECVMRGDECCTYRLGPAEAVAR